MLLLDEPLAALDAATRSDLRDEIRRIQHRVGTTAVFVTHDQSEAMAVADRVAVMDRGRILEVAAPAEIYERPASRFAATFVGSRNALELPVGPDRKVRWGEAFAVPAPDTANGTVLAVFRPEDVRITEQQGMAATVDVVVFLGAVSRVYLTVDGHTVHVDLPSYRTADATLAALVEALRPRWGELLLLIVSDHDQETVHDDRRIDLAGLAEARGVDATVFHEGTAAVVLGPDASDERWLADVAGVERSWLRKPGVRVVAAETYGWFATPDYPTRGGSHGGPRTRAQVAVASGGHPMVAHIAEAWRHRRPRAEDWAGLALAGFS